MALLAYSLRRTVGAIAVSLIAIWLIQLAVYHIPIPPRYPLETAPQMIFGSSAVQQALAEEWNTAAVEVGFVVLVVLGAYALWRVHKAPCCGGSTARRSGPRSCRG